MQLTKQLSLNGLRRRILMSSDSVDSGQEDEDHLLEDVSHRKKTENGDIFAKETNYLFFCVCVSLQMWYFWGGCLFQMVL